EEDYPVQTEAAEDYPVSYSEGESRSASGAEDYPAYYEDSAEQPVYYEEDEDGYRYYYDENGDYPVVFEEEEKGASDDWDSIIKEVLAPKQRELTEEEKERFERQKKWHGSLLYRLFQKTKPFRMKVKAWLDRNKLHPIKRFVSWCRSIPLSGHDLFFFAVAFSMTLSSHFYATIIAGLGCFAIAICFCTQFFRWKYLKPVLISVGFSFLFALYPMIISFIGGTKLQGSLYWAMSVMKGDSKEEDPDSEITVANPNLKTIEINGVTYYYMLADDEDEEDFLNGLKEQAGMSAEEIEEEQAKLDQQRAEEERLAAQASLSEKLLEKKNALDGVLDEYVMAEEGDFYGIPYHEVFYFLIAACFVLGLLCILRDSYFGRAVSSMALYAAFMLLLFIMKELGLPTIMDEDRARGFFGFVFPLVVGMAGDAAVFLILGFRKLRVLMQVVSGGLLAAGLYIVYDSNALITEPVSVGALQTNGAMTSTTRIINTYPNKHWTIVSANDELQMVSDFGWHTETITFLRGMEDYDATDSEMFIPTDNVFFYIEKVPLDYTVPYDGSGQKVSAAGAEKKLPAGNVKLDIYAGEPRWVVMSHMYYWAQQFMKLFPNEMEVFYEDDEFVCYRVRQDAYALYNFAIDYGYNAKSTAGDHRRRRSERE
ncbi:MAG: hypothetical protein IJT05_01800, partial [Lachnospiraceae bacterium]|nr:hypothetical protein [Lachnospiraceae bacterium]